MDYKITDKNENSKASVTENIRDDGIVLLSFHIDFGEPTVPSPVTVSWNVPVTDMWAIFSPSNTYQRNIAPSWRKRTTSSRLASGAPVHQLLSADNRNRLTIAVSDAMTPLDINTGVREATAEIICEVVFFTQQTNAKSSYDAEIRLDYSDIRYDEAIKRAEKYWAEECGYPSAYIPSAARESVYSTWYSFHQKMTADDIVAQCILAKPMGMNVVIVDDGWQIDYESKGYTMCGDWTPFEGKYPDMKAFVDRIHEIGMKVVLWVHLPAVGNRSRAYEELRGYALNSPDASVVILDPRYPYIRDYLCRRLTKNAMEWGLDGYKLDFIDSFKYFPETKSVDERFDTLSIDDGVDMLLHGIVDSLRAFNPEFMIEFRQQYTGPVIRKYGNMIRVGDCPNDSMRNHIAGTDLRFMLGKTPVHSDMLMWNPGDCIEACAMQVISTLFLVPQISVLLDKINDEQKRMLGFYLGFRNKHIPTLMDGNLTAENPECGYSLIRSDGEDETVAVSYSLPILRNVRRQRIYHINATSAPELYIYADADIGKVKFRVRKPTGDIISEGDTFLTLGIHRFYVPRGGMIEIVPAE